MKRPPDLPSSSTTRASRARLGAFEIIRPLGHGGMASVHLARGPEGSLVVLKKALRRDPALEAHILDEAKVGTRLHHPALVETRGLIADTDGGPVLVVDYIPGVPLDTLIRSGKVRTPVVLRIARQIASALSAIHTATDEHGFPLAMVHRDVSPSNIILGIDGDARLIDLGIVRYRGKQASETAQGFLRGKVKYLAPELFKTAHYSARTDLWALGVVVLELALGRSALRGGRAESIAKIIAGRLLELDQGEALDPRIEDVLRRLLAIDPNERYVDAAEAARELTRLEASFGDTRTLACLSLPAVPLDEAALSVRADPVPRHERPLTFGDPASSSSSGEDVAAEADHFDELVPTFAEISSSQIPVVAGVAEPLATRVIAREPTPWASSSSFALVGAANDFEDSGEITVDLPHLRGRRRRVGEAGLAGVVRSWVTDPELEPREQIRRYIDVLRGFESLPFVT